MVLTQKLFLSSFFILSIICILPYQAFCKNAAITNNYAPNDVLVRFCSWVDDTQKESIRKDVGAQLLKTIRSIEVEYWKLEGPITIEEALEYLNNIPEIEYAEPNHLYKLNTLPNDADFNKLWYLNNVGQRVNDTVGTPGADISANEAWDIETGNRDVIIAVIDSGVAFDHPDLSNNTWINTGEVPDNGIDDDENGYVDDIHGWDFVNTDKNPSDYSSDTDCDGHGTHVAGTIAAVGNNGIGISGVMWNAQIMVLQIFDLFYQSSFSSGYIQAVNIISAIEYAVENGAKIINCSFGGASYSNSKYNIIQYANSRGVLFVVAAGNNNNNNDIFPAYPASYDLPNIISVAATDSDDNLAPYSNYGVQAVDIAAPGGDGNQANIYSTVPPQRVIIFEDDFEADFKNWSTSGIYNSWSIGYDSLFWSNVVFDSYDYYASNENSYIQTADRLDARNCRGLHLQFKIDYDLENGYDFLYVEKSEDNVSYTSDYYATGSSNGILSFSDWESDLELGEFYLRFRLETDYSYNYDGVKIDDIRLTGVPWVFDGDEYDYKSGTSMAAPVVSGVIGLIWSLNPKLSHTEVKSILLNSVDQIDSLEGIVLAGGRVNAHKALQLTQQNGVKPNNLYFPHIIASNSNWETEICIINKSSEQDLKGDLIAYNDSGETVLSLFITLPANGRREIIVGDELINPESIGYMVFEPDSENACGYTKFYIEGKFRVAIPSTSNINTGDIYIPHIASNSKWWTGISLLNTTSLPKPITIEFNNGVTRNKTISGNEHKVFSIESLFNGEAQAEITSAVIKNASGIVGLELFGSTAINGEGYLSGILLTDETTNTIYYPHIASNSEWWTGIVAYNSSHTSSNLSITPYKIDGTALPLQTLTLAAQEKYIGSAKALNFPDGSAWIKVTSTSPIVGFGLFGTNDGKQLGGYSGVDINGSSGIFAKNQTEDGWTGVAFVNLEDSATTITMTAYGDNGNRVATETLNLNANEKIVSGAPGLFSEDIGSATYISYSSTGEVVGVQLNGSMDGRMLDALPGM